MSNEQEPNDEKNPDLKTRFKQFTQPLVDSLDGKIRDQVDHRVDERVEKALAVRLSVLEHALADLDREVKELKKKLSS
jgi:hypothetical protein